MASTATRRRVLSMMKTVVSKDSVYAEQSRAGFLSTLWQYSLRERDHQGSGRRNGECRDRPHDSCITSPLSMFLFWLWLPGSSELNVETILIISLNDGNFCFFILLQGLDVLFLFIVYVMVFMSSI